MAQLVLPASGSVYVDANIVIYSVEKHPTYGPLLQPLWQHAHSGTLTVVCSDLVLLEVLVGPLKNGNTTLVQTYEKALSGTDLRLIPITQHILREAANLRATTKLKTPDAVHAATAVQEKCAAFITNDIGFRNFSQLSITILDDLLTP